MASETRYQAQQRIKKARAKRNPSQVTETATAAPTVPEPQVIEPQDNMIHSAEVICIASNSTETQQPTVKADATPKIKKRPAPVGAWKPGQSGNPNGRPKELDLAQFRSMCREMAPRAIAELEKLAYGAERESVRMAALQYLLEHSYGKPVQPTENKNLTITSADLESEMAPEDAYKKLAAA